MRYHFTAVFESINDLQLFTKAMLSTELDRTIFASQKTLQNLSADIEETKEKLERLKIMLPKENKSNMNDVKETAPASPDVPRIIV